jgi:pimeloyl-ACP methyl ester carboxylesterase
MLRFKSENKRLSQLATLGCALLLGSGPLLAADTGRQLNELTQAETLAKSLPTGQAVWLNDEQTKFLAILTPDQSGQPKGGAILLHDADGHPDWPDVIRPLRTFLPPHGWATISIQLPRLNSNDGYGAHQPLINTRIQKAAEQLRTLGLNNIALIGHGSGAMAAAAYLASHSDDQGIRGFVGIGLSVIKTEKSDDYLPSQLEKIKLPILDIYGSRDLDAVTTSAKTRALAAKHSSNNAPKEQQLESYKKAGLAKTANNSIQGYIAYRQIEIEGADHNFSGQGEALGKRVLGWLERHVKGVAVSTGK